MSEGPWSSHPIHTPGQPKPNLRIGEGVRVGDRDMVRPQQVPQQRQRGEHHAGIADA